jgi:hypothetical protein
LKLEVPHSVILPDGSAAEVKRVSAKVIDGQLAQILYTVERESGAWTDVASDQVDLQDSEDNGDALPLPRKQLSDRS